MAVAPSPSDWKIINGSGAHGTAVVVKSATTSFETVSSIRASHPGQFGVIRLPVGEHGLYVINLYAIFDGRLADASTHRAISDLTPILAGRAEILMAGDFNAFRGYTLGSNKSELRRYETVFNRLSAFGLECLGPFSENGPLVNCPCKDDVGCMHVRTYRHLNRVESKPLQIDFAFGNLSLRKRLVSCRVLDDEKFWATSDHAPIEVVLDLAG